MNRIESIDIIRGFAVLQMIFWQTFDFFAKANIYLDEPYYNHFFNLPVHVFGGLFIVISGASAYISVSKKIGANVKKRDILLHAIKRYGGYILLSLFFTTFVLGFRVFYTWNEAIQGIGLTVLIAVLIILFVRSKWVFAALGLVLIVAQPFLRQILENDFVYNNFPYELISFNLFSNIVSFFLNLTVRGFFSLAHLLPMALLGVFLAVLIREWDRSKVIKFSSILGFVFIMVSLVSHFLFIEINLFDRSPITPLLLVGMTFLAFGVVEHLLIRFGKGRIFNFLGLFGKTAIIAYLFHFVLIYKPLKILNIESMLGTSVSYMLTVISVIIIYYACKMWLSKKDLISNKINPKNLFK